MLVWISDASGNYSYINSSGFFLAQEQAKISVDDWLQFVHPDDLARRGPKFKAAMEAREKYQCDYRIVKRDGSIRWVTSTALPRASDTGEFLGYVGVITESTHLHETLLNLATSEVTLRLLMENSSDLISQHAADTGNYLYASPSSEGLLGYKPAELIGTSCYDSFHPEDRKLVRAEILRQVEGDTNSKLIEFRVRHKEGHYVWVGAKVRVLFDPVTGEKIGSVVVSRDIEAERRAREELKRSEERFRSLTNLSSDWFWETDEHGRFTYMSDGLHRLFGIAPHEILGKTRQEWIGDMNDPGLLKYLELVSRQEAFRDLEYPVIVSGRGTVGYCLLAGEPLYQDGRFAGYRGVGRDITERVQAERRLEQLATHDTLTGLPNRAHLSSRLQHLLDRAGNDSQVAVLFVDLDRFKEVNDTLGHGRGDELLSEVARRLRNNIRADDIIARVGGDEFVIAAPCSQGAASATKLVENLFKALGEPMQIAGHEVFVRASVGISMYPADGQAIDALLQNADIAMYRAKEDGRKGYRFYKSEMAARVKERMTIDSALHRALERNEFELYYQPRLNLASMQVVGMEALLRWNNPMLGQVSPLEFIPVAEERGFISAIGKWVLEEACRQTRRVATKFNRELRVSVNLSARQLREEWLDRNVRQALEQAELPARMLELELTETALVEDMSVSAAALKRLKSLGVSLAVDDFGTGYSGLAYLGQFPLDVLKLDRSFVNQEAGAGPGSRRVIAAFVEMAHSLDQAVVAEGVETDDVLGFLRGIGCDEAQGYLIAKPMPAEEFEAFLSKRWFGQVG